jgi:hypothetical protein
MAEIELSRNGIVTLTAGRHSVRKSGKMSDVQDIRSIHSICRDPRWRLDFLNFRDLRLSGKWSVVCTSHRLRSPSVPVRKKSGKLRPGSPHGCGEEPSIFHAVSSTSTRTDVCFLSQIRVWHCMLQGVCVVSVLCSQSVFRSVVFCVVSVLCSQSVFGSVVFCVVSVLCSQSVFRSVVFCVVSVLCSQSVF